MIKLRYGRQGQVSFRDFNEYYFALGFLANPKNAELRWENNEEQGAWGSEGRIHCLVPQSKFPQFFRFTAGRGAVYARINCNDYVESLIYDHNFKYNCNDQDVKKILETVPEKYIGIFKDGYGGNLNSSAVHNDGRITKQNVYINSARHTQSKDNHSGATDSAADKVTVRIGDLIEHKAYGRGVVYSVEGQYFRIKFDLVGKKMFKNPDAFIKGSIKKV